MFGYTTPENFQNVLKCIKSHYSASHTACYIISQDITSCSRYCKVQHKPIGLKGRVWTKSHQKNMPKKAKSRVASGQAIITKLERLKVDLTVGNAASE